MMTWRCPYCGRHNEETSDRKDVCWCAVTRSAEQHRLECYRLAVMRLGHQPSIAMALVWQTAVINWAEWFHEQIYGGPMPSPPQIEHKEAS